MKELTIEQKAQRYDEVLNKAKNTIEVNQTVPDIIECVESLFPELKEKVSNGEKIRKAIIEGLRELKNSFHTISSIKIDDAISWLEQVDQESTNKIQLGKEYRCIASPRYSTFMKGNVYIPNDEFLCRLMNLCSSCFEPVESDEQKHDDKVKFKAKWWMTELYKKYDKETAKLLE